MVQDWCREKYVWTGELSSISDNILANCSQLQSREERERGREGERERESLTTISSHLFYWSSAGDVRSCFM